MQKEKFRCCNASTVKALVQFYVFPFRTEAQFIDPDCGDKVDYVIVLLYLPIRVHRLAGRYDNLMP